MSTKKSECDCICHRKTVLCPKDIGECGVWCTPISSEKEECEHNWDTLQFICTKCSELLPKEEVGETFENNWKFHCKDCVNSNPSDEGIMHDLFCLDKNCKCHIPPLEVKEGKPDFCGIGCKDPNCPDTGVMNLNPVKEGSKDIEWEKELKYKWFKHLDTEKDTMLLEAIASWWTKEIKSLLSQQETKIKRELKEICNRCKTERGLATAIGNYIKLLSE